MVKNLFELSDKVTSPPPFQGMKKRYPKNESTLWVETGNATA